MIRLAWAAVKTMYTGLISSNLIEPVDDLVLLKRLQCRPGIKVNGHHKALYRKIKWTESVHLYLSFSLKSNEDNGYLWTDTDGARENVFVTVFCKAFGVKNPPG